MRRFWLPGILLWVLAEHPCGAEDWPQFRGPNASGVSTAAHPLPSQFSSTENVIWSVASGDGISSPIVSRERVYLTSFEGDDTFRLRCFDADSGKQRWHTDWKAEDLPEIHRVNSHASATPATDGERIYVYFSTLGLAAVDLHGKKVWHRPLPRPEYIMGWGAAASPIVLGRRVIFNSDDDLDPFLVAVDAKNGGVLWRTARPDMLGGYAVPVVCRGARGEELVVAGTGKLQGFDPESGEERWTCNSLLRTILTTPVAAGDTVYVAVQSHGRPDRVLKVALLQHRDPNQDGKLEKSDVPERFWGRFDRGDANKDGFLEGEEIDRAFQSANNMVGGGEVIQAVRVGGSGDVTATHSRWKLEDKTPSNLSSPLFSNGRLFMVRRGGISSCYDAATGERIWFKKRIQNESEYFASPIAGDGKIFVAAENGTVVVLADAPELRVLATNDMGAGCYATPAIAGGRLFIRTSEKLYCVGEK